MENNLFYTTSERLNMIFFQLANKVKYNVSELDSVKFQLHCTKLSYSIYSVYVTGNAIWRSFKTTS